MTEHGSPEQVRPRRPLLILLLLAAVVAIGAISLPFITILFNILIPPQPPLPSVGMTQIRHDNYDYGVDEWVYDTATDPCLLLSYYQSTGVMCDVTPLQCSAARETAGDFTIQNSVVGRCFGSTSFSLFSMEWWALILRDPENPDEGQINTWREINWFGSPTSPE